MTLVPSRTLEKEIAALGGEPAYRREGDDVPNMSEYEYWTQSSDIT